MELNCSYRSRVCRFAAGRQHRKAQQKSYRVLTSRNHASSKLKNGVDHTGEVEPDMLAQDSIVITDDIADIATATTFIVTVPTPITDANQPDLSALESACNTIGPFLKKGDLVVFESTVYPGVTEDVCGPILAAKSGADPV